MDRRSYLGVLATALLAGCEGVDEPTATSETAPADATPTPAPPQTSATQSTESAPDTATETETPEGPNEDLESVQTAVTTAVDSYLSEGGGDSLTDVRPDTFVPVNRVRDPLNGARDTLEEIDRSSLPSDEQTRYDRLEGATWFAWWLGLSHGALHDSYDHLQSGWDALLDEEWDEAVSEWNAVSADVSDAEQFLDSLRSDSDRDQMVVFDSVSTGDYDAKTEQIEAHAADTSALASALLTVTDGFELYRSGGQYDYFEAEKEFSDAAETLRGRNWESTYSELVGDATCVADAMASGCSLLDEAERQTDDPDRSQQLREDASDRFNSCDIIESELDL